MKRFTSSLASQMRLQLLEIASCFVHHLVQRNILFFRKLFAVFKFRSSMTDVTVQSRDFHTYLAESCAHAYGFARKSAAAGAIGSRAEGCGFGKNQVGQRSGIVWPAKEREQYS